MDYLIVGKIVGTHGIKGEVKIKSDTSFKEQRYQKGSVLYLDVEGKKEKIIINSHREHQKMDLVTFNDNKNINDVLKYVGLTVYVSRDDLQELDEGEYYYDDLIGLTAYETNNEIIGIVEDIREVPQGIILVIKKNNGKNSLVPFVDEFVKKVDIENKIIIIDPIEGLL